MTEQVFVVPRAAVMDEAGWYGLRSAALEPLIATMTSQGRYVPRADAERDPSHKQIIPYLVLRDGPRIFLMRRTRKGADARLHDRYSIGVGGHLNPGDMDLEGGLRREWAEELVAGFVPTFEFVGLLNDDTTEVGAVHLGVVYVADAGGRPVEIRETEKLTGTFVERADVAEVADRLETWSRLILEALAQDAFADDAAGVPIIAGSARATNPVDPAPPVED